MVVALIAALVIATGMGYWLLSRREARPAGRPSPASSAAAAKAPPSKAPSTKAGGRFAAVEIRTRGNSCRTAKALEGHRFLAKDAPTLPLPKCTSTQCSCSFSKLTDRRTEGRRLDFGGGLSASQFLEKNRRTKRDRRSAAKARKQ